MRLLFHDVSMEARARWRYLFPRPWFFAPRWSRQHCRLSVLPGSTRRRRCIRSDRFLILNRGWLELPAVMLIINNTASGLTGTW